MLHNPFDLRGPEFLVFFVAFGLAMSALFIILRRRNEDAELRTFDIAQDAYQIAYLRGGRNHLIQSVVFSLLDRGLLKARDSKLRTFGANPLELARRPLEKAILNRYVEEDDLSVIYSDTDITEKAEDVGDRLRAGRLLPDEQQISYRRKLFLWGAFALWIVSGTKIYLALQRGHRNVAFLIILTVVFTFVVRKVTHPHRTAAGEKELNNLKAVFGNLYEGRGRLQLHTGTNELVMLLAIFGLSALPAAAADMVAPLNLRPVSGTGSGCGGSTDGGSCGGGSCGGGCGGGCGGCGS